MIGHLYQIKRIVAPVIAIVALLALSGETDAKKKPKVDFWPIEASIQQIFWEIRQTKDDSLAIRLHRKIEETLAQTLLAPEAYKYNFDSLRMIGRMYAPRKAFRIFNWNHSSRDGTYRYFAIIVLPGKKGAPSQVVRLTETTDTIALPDRQTLAPNQWLGCLYYKIIPKRRAKGGIKYYTLLGLDMHNLKTKKKYIELLTFDAQGNPRFGAPIIELNRRVKHRAIFEFSASQTMYLEYNWLRRRIEFDHLAPLMPYLVGQYEYYEPDQFRDGLTFRGNRWKHRKDIQKPPKDRRLKKRQLPKPPKIKPPKKAVEAEEPADEDTPDGQPETPK
jgi:hypothetical protein